MSVRFALVGDGGLALAIAKHISERAGVAVAAFSDELAGGSLPQGCALYGGAVLKGPDGPDVLSRCSADWLLSVNNFHHLVPHPVLELFGRRALNLHFGLLPEYAGRHAYQWAIRNGEHETGTTIHIMEPRFDSGDIVKLTRVPITDTDTGFSVLRKLITKGRADVKAVVDAVLEGRALTAVPQDLSRRHAYLSRDVGDGSIDWAQPAMRIVNFVRAGNFEPFPSPSYTARLVIGAQEISVLRAIACTGEAGLTPGSVLDVAETGPVFACAGGQAVGITRAKIGKAALTQQDWRKLILR